MILQQVRTVLEQAGVVFEPGLSADEARRVEERFNFVFPDDLREFLMFALPTGKGFHNWRDYQSPELSKALSWPLEGIWFDVQNNAFWPEALGAKPAAESEAFECLRARVAQAPVLIPIVGHRYMPDRPRASGNPVFSVYQTDIIYYGANLEEYLRNEFNAYFGTNEHRIAQGVREIEFWSALAG